MGKLIFNQESIVRKIGEGKEAFIYLYGKDNDLVALKRFKNAIVNELTGDEIPITDEFLKNKEEKIKLIPDIKELSDEVKVCDSVYDENGKFIGFTMELDYYKSMNFFMGTNNKKKIDYLKQLREKVVQLNEAGIYIGDFNPSNFAIKKNGIKLFDIDYYRIGDLDFDYECYGVSKYKKGSTKIENIDNYGFNYFTLSYLMNVVPFNVDYNVEVNGLPSKLRTKENKVLYKKLQNIDNNYDGGYFIDSMKKGLFN